MLKGLNSTGVVRNVRTMGNACQCRDFMLLSGVLALQVYDGLRAKRVRGLLQRSLGHRRLAEVDRELTAAAEKRLDAWAAAAACGRPVAAQHSLLEFAIQAACLVLLGAAVKPYSRVNI